MSDFDFTQFAIDNLTCTYCGRFPGQRCTTASGRTAEVHAARFGPIQEAWAGGYIEAEDGLLDMAIDSPDLFQKAVERHRCTRKAVGA